MHHPIHDLIAELETDLATELRIIQSTVEREHNGFDLASEAAAFRRAHPWRALFRGMPGDLTLAESTRVLALVERIGHASPAIRDALKPVYANRVLTWRDVATVNRILDLDRRCSRAKQVAEAIEFNSAAEDALAVHPLHAQWAHELSAAENARLRPAERVPGIFGRVLAWSASTHVGLAALACVPFWILGLYEVIRGGLSPVLWVAAGGIILPLAGRWVVQFDDIGRGADSSPDDTRVGRIVSTLLTAGCTAEATRAVLWHQDRTLNDDALDHLKRAAKLRKAMSAAMYAEQAAGPARAASDAGDAQGGATNVVCSASDSACGGEAGAC